MKKTFKTVISVILAIIMAMTMMITPMAGTADGADSILDIQIKTDSNSYGVLGVAKITVKITNVSENTVYNVSAEALIDQLDPCGRGSEVYGEADALEPGETLTFTYKATLDSDVVNLNGWNSFWLSIIRFFQGSSSSFAPDFDDGRESATVSKIISFGRYDVEQKVRVWYEDPNNAAPMTRGEWVQILAEKLGMNVSIDAETVENYYADTAGSPYGVAIEVANLYGILPPPEIEDLEQDVPLFYPDEVATREFAAYTVVKAMGFDGAHNFDISLLNDYSDIKYQDEVAIAIGFDFFKLRNNWFNPNDALTVGDKKVIFKAIDQLNASTVVEPGEEYDNSVLQSDVVKEEISDLTDYVVADLNGEKYKVTLPKTADTTALAVGEVIILPENDEYITGLALKITSISSTGSQVVLTCVEPAIEEVFETIDFAGFGTPAVDKVEPAEDVEYEYIEGRTASRNPRLNIDVGGSTPVPGKLKFDLAEKEFSEFLKASGTVEIEVPDVTCIVKGKLGIFNTKIDEFTFSISEDIKFDASLEYTLAESGYELTNGAGNTRWEGGRIELGRLPIKIGATGMSFDIVFFFNVEAKGTVSVTYTIHSTQGYQYKNGASRFIFDYDDELSFLEIKGSAKAGLGISGVLCAFSLMDLIGYSVEAGVAFNASFTPHVLLTDTLYCGDITLYAYCTSGLDQETAIGLFLKEVRGYTLEFEHLKNDSNNPFKLKLHIENGVRVPECTFGTGTLSGVVSCFDTGSPIADARVCIYTSTNTTDSALARTLYTDENGEYDVNNLCEGTYTIVVSATGYYTYTVSVDIKKNENTYVENLLMIDRNYVNVTVSGTVVDAVTGSGLSGTSYKLRKGWNNTTGEVITSGTFASSSYSLELVVGNYTLQVSKNGYITTHTNIAVSENGYSGTHVALSPEGYGVEGSGLRIVLTWGQYPSDLDSHLFGPTAGGSTFHTYYSQKDAYYNSVHLANLDVDDISSYGPETTTIYHIQPNGMYSFYIHDFTNRHSTSSKQLSQSGAKVQVYSGNTRIVTFNVPTNKEGTVWHVFDYDPATDRIIPVNTFHYSSNTSTLRNPFNPLSGAVSPAEAIKVIADSAKIDK